MAFKCSTQQQDRGLGHKRMPGGQQQPDKGGKGAEDALQVGAGLAGKRGGAWVGVRGFTPRGGEARKGGGGLAAERETHPFIQTSSSLDPWPRSPAPAWAPTRCCTLHSDSPTR